MLFVLEGDGEEDRTDAAADDEGEPPEDRGLGEDFAVEDVGRAMVAITPHLSDRRPHRLLRRSLQGQLSKHPDRLGGRQREGFQETLTSQQLSKTRVGPLTMSRQS